MPVSQTTEYALRAVVKLAMHPGDAMTTQQLSAATGVPHSYLPKVLQPLTRCGILTAQRGMHGGYKLNKPPSELSVRDVIQCVDSQGHADPHAADDDLPSAFAPLLGLLRQVDADAEQRFAITTIDQLTGAIAPPTETGNES